MRSCDRCGSEMAAGRPRVRVARELWCQTCVKDKSAPSGKYKPGSDIASTAHLDPADLMGFQNSREFVRADMKGSLPRDDRDRAHGAISHLREDHGMDTEHLHGMSSAEIEAHHQHAHAASPDDRSHSHTLREFNPHSTDALPYSLSSHKVAVEDFHSRYQADHDALEERYRGQHGKVTKGPDQEPVYEISHPSGYLGRIGHGPHMAISHQATPDQVHDTVSVGAMGDGGHSLHPSMKTEDPLVNHHRAMWHLDNWVKTWGEQHSQATPALKNWRGRRGLASKASTESKEPGFMRKIALTNIRTGQRIIVVAHDSGDGQTIYHCPFCGSGQVIARSDGTIECEFCHTMFTVQVQPEYNAFPQTINGQPVQVPGMPGQIDDPTDPMAGADPNDPTQTDFDQDGEADATDADTDGDGVSDNFAGPASATNQPPWLKGAVLRTSTGTYLDPEDFIAHLAIKHADDKTAVAKQVRASRRSQ